MNKAIILDRDGTIIYDRIYLNNPDDISYLPNAIEGLRQMRSLGYRLFVATNQSGVARGLVTLENLEAIHRRMMSELAAEGIQIEKFYFAPYGVETNHPFRKPNPGMLLECAREHGIDLSLSWMIGDRASDIEAGKNAGTKTILLTTPPTPPNEPTDLSTIEATSICSDLIEAARFITSYKSAPS